MSNITLKIDLEISAEKIISQLHIHNQDVESQIEAGIKQAIEELAAGNGLIDHVRQATLKSVLDTINKSVMRYDLQYNIQKIIGDKIQSKIEAYADKVAEQVTKNLL